MSCSATESLTPTVERKGVMPSSPLIPAAPLVVASLTWSLQSTDGHPV